LSNLLDNAIEACCRLDACRVIQCNILFDRTLFLSVRNTSNPVTIVGNTIPTSKTPKDEHGFGLSRIQLILKQLNAEYTFVYENGWFEFVAELPSICE
jgi:sensor histidine kinase regulating citrate/malate metabolism